MSTGLLLGAGASYELGMPLVWQLTKELRAFYTPQRFAELNALWRQHGGGHKEEIVSRVAGLFARSDLHYENVLGVLQTEHRRLGQDQALAQDYHALYQRLVESVCALLGEQQVKSFRYARSGFAPFEGLRELAHSSQPLWVFSLNHDITLELLAAHVGVPVRDGFWPQSVLEIPNFDKHGRERQGVRAEVLTQQQLEQQDLHLFRRGEPGINLLKLHGGLDIFAFRDRQDLCRLVPNSPDLEGFVDSLRIANTELAFWDRGGRFHVVNHITFRDRDGQSQFLQRSILAGSQKFNKRFDQTLPHRMLELFSRHLNGIQTLYVIGYSFGDPHVDRAIREWLETLANRKLVIVDPFRTALPGYLSHLVDQIELRRQPAGEFFASFRTTPMRRAERFEQYIRRQTRPWRDELTIKRIAQHADRRLTPA